MSLSFALARRGLLSDRLVRFAVRRAFLTRLGSISRREGDSPDERFGGVLEAAEVEPWWRPGTHGPSVLSAQRRAEILGPRRLEAAAHWPVWAKELDAAEAEMLGLVIARAELCDGQDVLIVGGRWAAAAHRLSEEVAPSRLVVWTPLEADAHDLAEDARRVGLAELETRSGPLAAAIGPDRRFDRILVIEGLPADSDPRAALSTLGDRLVPGGTLFLQLACHRRHVYRLSARERLWLGFTEPSLVPSTDLVPRLAIGLGLRRHWELSGEHYERTARAWRTRLERKRAAVLAELESEVGARAALDAFTRWRLALLAREELFGLRGGQEWWVSQYLLAREEPSGPQSVPTG